MTQELIIHNKLLLTKGPDGLWRDSKGTIYAIPDLYSADILDQCGVAPFTLPIDDPATPSCVIHDRQWVNPTWRYFYARSQSNADFYDRLRADGVGRIKACTMWAAATVFGKLVRWRW